MAELAEALRPWTPAPSRHRIDAIKKALGARRSGAPRTPSDPRLEASSSDPSPAPNGNEKETVASGKPPRLEQRGGVVVPADRDAASAAVLGATAVAVAPRERERAVSSRSLATSPVTLDEQDRSRRPKTWVIAAVAVAGLAVGGIIVVALATRGTGRSIGADTAPSAAPVTPSGDPSAASAAPAAGSSSASAGAATGPAASEISTAIVLPPVPSARTTAPAKAGIAPAAGPRPTARPSVVGAAPATAPTPRKTGGELILDRKRPDRRTGQLPVASR